MIACYYKKETNPEEMNTLLKQNNGFVSGGLYVWGAFSRVNEDIEEIKTTTPQKLSDTQMNEIKGALDLGYPVMLQLDFNPKTSPTEMHYVLATSYNINDENDITRLDRS